MPGYEGVNPEIEPKPDEDLDLIPDPEEDDTEDDFDDEDDLDVPEDEEDEDFSEDDEDDTELDPVDSLVAAELLDAIALARYMKLPSKLGHVCELTMKNGLHIIGGRVSMGEAVPTKESKARAYAKALQKAMELETYARADRRMRGHE